MRGRDVAGIGEEKMAASDASALLQNLVHGRRFSYRRLNLILVVWDTRRPLQPPPQFPAIPRDFGGPADNNGVTGLRQHSDKVSFQRHNHLLCTLI